MKFRFSGKQVIRAGEDLILPNIVEQPEAFTKAMNILSEWRFSHDEAIFIALNKLKPIAIKKDRKAIFAHRLKRHRSIVAKLLRFKKMKLKNMQDIGGCRAIVSNEKKLLQIVRDLKRMPEFKNLHGKYRIKNYLNTPKDDGYRGFHIIGSFRLKEGVRRNIEIQLRTLIQHYWATAIEIIDLFENQELKFGFGDENWKKFFIYVSKQLALMEKIHMFETFPTQKQYSSYLSIIQNDEDALEGCKQAQFYAKKLRVLEKLNVYTESINVIDEQLVNSDYSGSVLILLDIEKKSVSSVLYPPEASKEAEKAYLEAEKENANNENVTVAKVSADAVGGIKEAYPNYFADSKGFFKYLKFITDIVITNDNPLFKTILKHPK